jgi:hypothetical protein
LNTTLEKVDMHSQTVTEINITNVDSNAVQYNKNGIVNAIRIFDGSSYVIAALDTAGAVRIFDTDQVSLFKSLSNWKEMVGAEVKRESASQNVDGSLKTNPRPLEEVARPKFGVDMPKHGKEDPDNKPHVGGNTWAGNGWYI